MSLNLARNLIGAKGAKHVAEALKVNVSVLRFDWYHSGLDLTSGTTAVVYGYSYYNTTKGAMTSLNISNNNLARGKQTGGFRRGATPTYATDMSGNNLFFYSCCAF